MPFSDLARISRFWSKILAVSGFGNAIFGFGKNCFNFAQNQDNIVAFHFCSIVLRLMCWFPFSFPMHLVSLLIYLTTPLCVLTANSHY